MNYKGKKGVDISSVNGDVDIQKIKDAGYDFVMIRCGFGSDRLWLRHQVAGRQSV